MRQRLGSRLWWCAAVALALAACSGAPSPAPSPSPTTDLVALRTSYGLPDCPDTEPSAAAVTDGLPVTALPCLGSEKLVNLAGLERRPTVVNLWAQWCGPCRVESPFLREVSKARTDVAFIGINYQDPKPDWAVEFAGLVEWKYPHVQDMDRTLREPLAVPGLPLTLVVDAAGRIVARHAGPFESTTQLNEFIDGALGTS